MRNLASPVDTAVPEAIAAHRHRPARTESFPADAQRDYEAREVQYVRSLLADPLRELARTITDDTRAIAEGALALDDAAEDPVGDRARLEEALERIAVTTADDVARAIAEDALALYRGR